VGGAPSGCVIFASSLIGYFCLGFPQAEELINPKRLVCAGLEFLPNDIRGGSGSYL
jgi:hypothetical protein